MADGAGRGVLVHLPASSAAHLADLPTEAPVTLADLAAFLKQPAGRRSIYPLLALVGAAGIAGGFVVGQLFDSGGARRTEGSAVMLNVTRSLKVEKKALNRKTYDKKVTLPDGTKTEEHSEVLVEKLDTTTTTDASSSTTSVKKTEKAPDWRVGVLAGATWKEPALVVSGPLVLGVTVERRIIGPFSLGVWGTTQGAAGASISGEF